MRWRTDRLAGAALLFAAACGGDGGGTPPPTPARVVVTPATVEAHTSGQTFQFSARVVGSDGNPMPGVPVTWTSSDEDVATVSQSGLATVAGQGRADVRATAESASGRASVVADLQPAEIVKVSGDDQTAPALTQAPEEAVVRVTDGAGLPLSGVRVEWEAFAERGRADPPVTRTNDSGEASTRWTLGLPDGDLQDLRAHVAGTALYVDFRVRATDPPLTVLTTGLPRGRATLPYEAVVEPIGGVPPFAWSIAAGELPAGLALDSAGLLAGTVSDVGTAEFTVAVRDSAGTEATAELSLRVCPAPLALDVGQAEVLDPFWGGCAPFLPAGRAGDRYHVALVRTVVRPDLRAVATRVEIREPWPGDDASSAEPGPARRSPLGFGLRPDLAGYDPEADRRRLRMKADLLARSEQLMRERGPAALLPDRGGGAQAQRLAATSPPPATRALRPTTWEDGPCQESPPARVRANLVGYNGFLAIYQDSVQQTTFPVDTAAAAAVLDYYAAFGASTIEEYFGGVTDVDGDGRVVLFVTPVVSQFAAYVWGPDFLAATACPGSNEMEIVYYNQLMFARVVDSERLSYQALPTTVHEVAHIASLYRRATARSWHPAWAEEGRAEIAGEISSRKALAAAGVLGGTDVFDRGAYPPRPGSVISPDNTGVLLRLVRTAISYSQPYNSVTQDPTEEHTFYGTSWHFHRFLGDAYGDAGTTGDADFFRRLTSPSARAGVAGIEAATGKSVSALMVEYATAMAVNGTGAPAPERGFRTYDFRSAMTDLFSPTFEDRPRGAYPWPATGTEAAPFDDHVFQGYLYPAGIQFHEFESDGRGEGIEVEATIDGSGAQVVIVRVR